jgi:hypothetical protein
LLISSCKSDKLAIAGSGWHEIAIIDKHSGVIEWRHPLNEGEECNAIEVMPDGNILYTYMQGVRLINRKHEVLWDYKAGENEEIHAATRLKNGNIVVGVCGQPARIIELKPDGVKDSEISFHSIVADPHRQFRKVFKSDSGLYYVPLFNRSIIMRLNTEGDYKGTVTIIRKPYDIVRHKNGNLIVSCHEAGSIMTINPNLKKVNNYHEVKQLKGAVLVNPAQIRLFDNDNLMIANSNTLSADKSQPLMIEINSNFDVVWTLPHNSELKNITTFYPFKE